jgi:hypothetical protein
LTIILGAKHLAYNLHFMDLSLILSMVAIGA